jgi:hypothetical protein
MLGGFYRGPATTKANPSESPADRTGPPTYAVSRLCLRLTRRDEIDSAKWSSELTPSWGLSTGSCSTMLPQRSSVSVGNSLNQKERCCGRGGPDEPQACLDEQTLVFVQSALPRATRHHHRQIELREQ